jgi:hypothetical protein
MVISDRLILMPAAVVTRATGCRALTDAPGSWPAPDRGFHVTELALDDAAGVLHPGAHNGNDPVDLPVDLVELGPVPVSFRSFESNTRNQGDRIWQ